MPTIDLSPIQGLPFSDARPYLEQCLGLSDRLDGTSDAYALGYLSRATRMDLGKICSRGTACGSSCIPRKKQCSPDKAAGTSTLAKEASAKARGKLIGSLKAERDKKRTERSAKRQAEAQKQPQGAFGSFPSKATLGEIRDRFKTTSGLSGNAGELPHEKAGREKFEQLAKRRSLQQAITEAETRLATGIDEDGDPIDEPMRRATERQLEQQKQALIKAGGELPPKSQAPKERLEIESLKQRIPDDTKRPKTATREAAAEAVASLNRLYRSKIDAIAEASPIMRVSLNFRAGRTYPDEPSTYYRGRIMGIRTKGDPHPTMTNQSLRTAIEKSEKDMKYRLGKFVEEAYKVGAPVPDDIAKEFPDLADQYKKQPAATKEEEYALQGRSRPTQFKSRTGRTVSIDSLYSDRSDSFQRGYLLRMVERGDSNPYPTKKVVEYGDRRILIQTPKGQHRFFGAVPQQADYGVIAGTYGMGGDGRSLDCYVGDNLEGGKCYEVQQLKRSGEPDEVKLMLGFNSPDEASSIYKAHVPESRFGSIREIDFNSYMRGDTTAAQQKKVGKVMHEFKVGKLKSGSGAKVKSRKQAVAIALSEAGAVKR